MDSRVITHCITYFGLLFLLQTSISCNNTTEENLKKLAVANNEFALNLHKQLAGGSAKNIFFSPLSLSTAFGMLYYGIRGESAKELRNVLGYQKAGLADESVHLTFNRLMSQATSLTNGYILNSASAILVDKHLSLNPEYRTAVQDLYLAPVRRVNFQANGPAIVNDINNWVKSKTRGKINRLVSRLDPLTVMVILNAVYFKGQWETPFHPRATRSTSFFNGGLETGAKTVSMMHHASARFPYAAMPDFQALELPYDGNQLSMLILLPKQRDGLSALERSLTNEKLDIIRQNMSLARVDVSLPKFKIEFQENLVDELKALGALKIFHGGTEDFSGISEKDSKELFVSSVVHKSVVEVNEEGTKAAAATGIILMVKSRPMNQFRADHPFLFVIMEKRNNFILFMGSVKNM